MLWAIFAPTGCCGRRCASGWRAAACHTPAGGDSPLTVLCVQSAIMIKWSCCAGFHPDSTQLTVGRRTPTQPLVLVHVMMDAHMTVASRTMANAAAVVLSASPLQPAATSLRLQLCSAFLPHALHHAAAEDRVHARFAGYIVCQPGNIPLPLPRPHMW